jgi:hypothetical protein
MRCDQCRHWLIDHGDGTGMCRIPRLGRDVVQADREARQDLSLYVDQTTAAAALLAAKVYIVADTDRAELYTAPDFFCALFAAKT